MPGFVYCTPIQAQTLPSALQGPRYRRAGPDRHRQDRRLPGGPVSVAAVQARPASRQPTSMRALIVAPTRELAVQIHKDADGAGQAHRLKLAVVFGGTDYEKQRRTVADGVDVLVGTPAA